MRRATGALANRAARDVRRGLDRLRSVILLDDSWSLCDKHGNPARRRTESARLATAVPLHINSVAPLAAGVAWRSTILRELAASM
jgi:hypothetical protein